MGELTVKGYTLNRDGFSRVRRDTMGDCIEDGTEPAVVVCPVCGQLLHESSLPDMECIIYENLYHQGSVRICSSRVQLCFEFGHCYDEDGFRMDNPHDLVGVVDAEFDQAGDCTGFVLVEVRAADNVKIQTEPDRRVT